MDMTREKVGKYGIYNPATLTFVDMAKFTVSDAELNMREQEVWDIASQREREFLIKEQGHDNGLELFFEDVSHIRSRHPHRFKCIICYIYGDPQDYESGGYANLNQEEYENYTFLDLEIYCFAYFTYNEKMPPDYDEKYEEIRSKTYD